MSATSPINAKINGEASAAAPIADPSPNAGPNTEKKVDELAIETFFYMMRNPSPPPAPPEPDLKLAEIEEDEFYLVDPTDPPPAPAPQAATESAPFSRVKSFVSAPFSRVESFVNDRSIMTGSLIKWDKPRLKHGKLEQLAQIGSTEVKLITPSGDKIHGSYVSAENFHRALAEMGGKRRQVEVIRKQSFLANAKPIKISCLDVQENLSGVQIDNPQSTNIPELVDFCSKNGCTAFWGDKTLVNPAEYPKRYAIVSLLGSYLTTDHHSGQPIYIVKNYDAEKFKSKESIIALDREFSDDFRLFSPEPLFMNGIIFDKGDIEKVNELLKELKIQKTNWEMFPIGESYFLGRTRDIQILNTLTRHFTDQDVQLISQELPPVDTSQSGVVLATMNQTNSYTQYTHEMLMFLLEGANVFFYDNGGKGLSKGQNTQSRMIEAIETAYEFLSKKLNFPEGKILIKGQCSGGVISAAAAGNHPNSPVWIDQSPNSFQEMVGHLFVDYLEEGLHTKNKKDLLSKSLRAGGKTLTYMGIPWAVSKLLPNIVVADQLKRNNSLQIYTIGIPDSRGLGGDKLVPQDQSTEIIQQITTKGGTFVPIHGGTHVTDWWIDPSAYAKHVELLIRAGIISINSSPSR